MAISGTSYSASNIYFDAAADYRVGGLWEFLQPPQIFGLPNLVQANAIYIDPLTGMLSYGAVGGGGGTITGGANVGGGEEVFKDVVGTNLRFRTLVAGAGMVLTPGADTLTLENSGAFDPTANIVFSGNDSFIGQFSVNAPSGNVNITASAADLNLVANGNATLQSNGAFSASVVGDQVNIGANNAVFVSSALNTIIVSAGDSINASAVNNVFLSSSSGFILVNAGTNLTLQAGTIAALQAPDCNVIASTGNIGLTAQVDLNIVCNTGNFSASSTAGTAIISSFGNMTLQSTSGALSLTSNGNLNPTAGDSFISVAQNHYTITTNAGNIALTSANHISLTPTADLYATIPSQAAAVAPPVISPPAGFSYVVREDATGKLWYLT